MIRKKDLHPEVSEGTPPPLTALSAPEQVNLDEFRRSYGPIGPADQLADHEIDSGILIGVCGVPESGKTVFLTCIYQTAGSVMSDEGKITTDAPNTQGAYYFRNQELSIRTTGATTGTRENAIACFSIRLNKKIPGLDVETLPVYLLDFAGGHFEWLADLRSIGEETMTTEQRQQLLEVHRFLDACDGLIVLISAKEFKREGIAGNSIPFPKAVEHLVDRSARLGRPVALLFTQSDLNVQLTDENLGHFPTVARFRQRFTSDYSQTDAKPFGIVKLMTCYELDQETGHPKAQDSEGNIWRTEAREVFVSILRAAWPLSVDRIKNAARARYRDRINDEVKKQRGRSLAAQERRQKRIRGFMLLFLILAVFAVGAIALQKYLLTSAVRKETEFVQQLGSRLAGDAIDPVHPEDIQRLKTAVKLLAVEDKAVLNQFWEIFHRGLSNFLSEPASLDSRYARRIDIYRSLGQTLPEPSPVWWDEEIDPKLRGRREFLAFWTSKKSASPLDRLHALLERKKSSFGQGDLQFVDFLGGLIRQETSTVLANWSVEMKLKTTLADRLSRIADFVQRIDSIADPEFGVEARGSLAEWIISSEMEFEDSKLVKDNIDLLLPEATENFRGYKIPYRILHERIGERVNGADAVSLISQTERILAEYRLLRENRMHAVNSALSSIVEGTSPGEQHAIVSRIFERIKADYIFDLSRSAWPAGIQPRVWVLERQFSISGKTSEKDTKRSDLVLLKSISFAAIYSREFDALAALVRERYARHKAVEVYAGLLRALGQHALLPRDSQRVASLIHDFQSPPGIWIHEEGAARYVERQREEIRKTKAVLDSFAKWDARALPGVIQKEFRRHCRLTEVEEKACVDFP